MQQMRAAVVRQEQLFDACLVTFEILRRLGFSADQVFFMLDDAMVGMSLLVGDKRVNFAAGPRERLLTAPEITKMWGQHAEEKWNKGSEISRNRIWSQHAGINATLAIVLGVIRAGIEIPDKQISESMRGISVSAISSA